MNLEDQSRHFWAKLPRNEGEFQLPEKHAIRQALSARIKDFREPSCPIRPPSHFTEIGAGLDCASTSLLNDCWWTDQVTIFLSDPVYEQSDVRNRVIAKIAMQFDQVHSQFTPELDLTNRDPYSQTIVRGEKSCTIQFCLNGLPDVPIPKTETFLHLVSVANYVDLKDLSAFIHKAPLWGLTFVNSLDAGLKKFAQYRHPKALSQNQQLLRHLPAELTLLHAVSHFGLVIFYELPRIGCIFIKTRGDEERRWIQSRQILQALPTNTSLV